MNENNDALKFIEIAKLAGMLMLENGSETFRAEETVTKICEAGGYGESDVIALPTGIFVTVIRNGVTVTSICKRVKKRTINLYKMERANSISRALVSGTMTADEALMQLNALNISSNFNKLLYAAIAGISTALFTILYGGKLTDGIVSLLCGFIVQYISSLFKRTDIYRFAISIIGGIIITAIAVLADNILGSVNIDKIIIGSIIPLLPGLAMTNAIRDTMMGDLVSGTSRFTEVILIAMAIAAGVGTVFTVYIYFGGVL